MQSYALADRFLWDPNEFQISPPSMGVWSQLCTVSVCLSPRCCHLLHLAAL